MQSFYFYIYQIYACGDWKPTMMNLASALACTWAEGELLPPHTLFPEMSQADKSLVFDFNHSTVTLSLPTIHIPAIKQACTCFLCLIRKLTNNHQDKCKLGHWWGALHLLHNIQLGGGKKHLQTKRRIFFLQSLHPLHFTYFLHTRLVSFVAEHNVKIVILYI